MSPEPIPSEKFEIDGKDEMLGLYQFEKKTAKHYFCKNCGIYPFHETSIMPDHFRANLGCIEGIDSFSLDVGVFDGKHLL